MDIPYTLATEEAERIGVDHVARLSVADTGDSSTGKFPCTSGKSLLQYKPPCLEYLFIFFSMITHGVSAMIL